jgi:hypothetical protein
VCNLLQSFAAENWKEGKAAKGGVGFEDDQ